MFDRRLKLCLSCILFAAVAACGGGGEGEPAAVCGNGTVEAGEQCDDGNPFSGDGCSAECLLESVDPGDDEQCTGGEDEDGDGLVDCDDDDCAEDAACASVDTEVCTGGEDEDGDGLVDCADDDCAQDEACASTDVEICTGGEDEDGDGAVDCDDSDCADDPACSTAASCGDGVVDDGEECDDGDDNSDTEPDACRSDCTSATCGDGVVDSGEACDEGPDGTDACTATCEIPFVPQCTDTDEFVLEQVATPRGQALVWTGSTADWSDDRAPEAGCTRNSDGPEAVFRWTPPTTQWVLLTTESAETTVPTILELGAANCDDPIFVGCNERSYARGSTIHTVMQANTTYYIYAHALEQGDVSLEVIPSQLAGTEGAGCSAVAGLVCEAGLTCTGTSCAPIPGTCGDALDGPSVLSGSWTDGYAGEVSIAQQGNFESGSCGGDAGDEIAFAFVAETDGEVTVTATSDQPVSVYLRRQCDSAGREFACGADGVASGEVFESAPFYVIVDSADAFGADVSLRVDVVPRAEEGEACGDDVGVCASGLVCSPTRSTCVLPPGDLEEACDATLEDEACMMGLSCVDADVGAYCIAADGRSCAQPLMLNDAGVQVGNRLSATFDLDDGVSEVLYESSCGRTTTQVVEWIAPADGTYRVDVTPSVGATLRGYSQRDVCFRRSTERACVGTAPPFYTQQIDALGGEARFFHLSGTGNVTIQVTELVTLDEGDACDPASETAACAAGLFCGDARVCEEQIFYSCDDITTVIGSVTELAGGVEFEFDLRGGGNAGEGSCGGALGNEGNLLLAPAYSGFATVEILEGDADFVLYARSTCDDADSERACVDTGAGDDLLEFEIIAGDSAVITVDSDDPAASSVVVSVRYEGGLGIGEDCSAGTCEPGLVCNDEDVCARRLRAEGEVCEPAAVSECEDGLFCALVDDGFRCSLIGGEGTECLGDDECAAGYACGFELGASVGGCTLEGANGDACVTGSCEEGLACFGARFESTCSGVGEELGDRCDPTDRRCGPGLYCEPYADIYGGTCQNALAIGERCDEAVECISTYCAFDAAAGGSSCQEPTARGEECREDAQCGLDSACIPSVDGLDARCEIVPTPEGEICSFDRGELCADGLVCVANGLYSVCANPE